MLEELFRETSCKKFYTSVGELQTDLDEWLTYFNVEAPYRRCRNKGERPIETIVERKNLKSKKAAEQINRSGKNRREALNYLHLNRIEIAVQCTLKYDNCKVSTGA
jgi:hypothetical protein